MKKFSLSSILDKNNKIVGLSIVITTLVMLISSAIGIMWNPIYLIEYVTFVPLFGEWGSALVYIGVLIFASFYYLEAKISIFTKRRIYAFIIFSISLFMFFLTIHINTHNGLAIVWAGSDFYNIVDVYKYYVLHIYAEPFISQISTWGEVSGLQIGNLGIIIPLVIWIQSIFGFADWFGFLIWIPITLYFLYVFLMDDWQIYLAKLNPINNEKEQIKSNKKIEGLDLNQATEEFELNFSPEEREKIELIEKVRGKIDKTSYEELSSKIKGERDKLYSLRNQVINKVRDNNSKPKKTSEISGELKEKLQSTLGYTSYTQLRKQKRENKANELNMKENLNKQVLVQEEKIEENLTLLNEGYKTTEQTLTSDKAMLTDDFVNSLLENSDPTMEIPLISDYYNDIFKNDKKLEDEINNTLETKVEFYNNEKTTEREMSEVSGSIIIDNLKEEVTMEEYLSLPEEIEKTVEKVIDLNQVHAIVQQKNDQTIKKTYESYASSSSEVTSIEETTIIDEIKDDEDEFSEERPLDWCSPYVLPSTSILSSTSNNFNNSKLVDEATEKVKKLNEVFNAFSVKAVVNSFEIGPTVSTFKVELSAGIKTTKVTNLEDNIKLTLGAEYIRIQAPIPGTPFIGIEVPNSSKKPVTFKEVYDQTPSLNEGIQISIGQDVSGSSMSFDLTKAPHLLVAGSTGSGKSVAINTILASILLRYKPTDVQLVLIDPKMVEFAPFHGIPHLLAEVITDATNANKALQAMVQEMEDRYREMAQKGAKKIEELNEILIKENKPKKPYIVVIIDELADLMMVAAKEVEESIMRITQKARAAGIHMVLATQRPSTEIITGTIKSNIPSRMAFTVASSIDSRTILGQVGAEKLIGMGDMLVSLYGKLPIRGQGAYISNSEVEDISAFTKSQCSAHYMVDVSSFATQSEFGGSLIDTDDPMYLAAIDTVKHYQKASTSMLQRHLGIGYNKAANIIETMEAEGIVGPSKGSKPREVLLLE